MTQTVFIDGAAGTTGLEIAERLAGRSEFALVTLDEARPEIRRSPVLEELRGSDAVTPFAHGGHLASSKKRCRQSFPCGYRHLNPRCAFE